MFKNKNSGVKKFDEVRGSVQCMCVKANLITLSCRSLLHFKIVVTEKNAYLSIYETRGSDEVSKKKRCRVLNRSKTCENYNSSFFKRHL